MAFHDHILLNLNMVVDETYSVFCTLLCPSQQSQLSNKDIIHEILLLLYHFIAMIHHLKYIHTSVRVRIYNGRIVLE